MWLLPIALSVCRRWPHLALRPCGPAVVPIRMMAAEPAFSEAFAAVAATDCWRPSLDDVDRISWGRPAKKKGTGSRGVPHRLNNEVRWDISRLRGAGSEREEGITGRGWLIMPLWRVSDGARQIVLK